MRALRAFYRHSWILLLGVWFLVVVAGYGLVLQYVGSAQISEVREWHSRLALLADLHESKFQAALNSTSQSADTVAENPLVQLFLTELSAANWNVTLVPDSDIRLEFINNLLVSVMTDGKAIPATANEQAAANPVPEKLLAIVTPSGSPLMIPPAGLEFFKNLTLTEEKLASGNSATGPVWFNGKAYLVFKAPIRAVQQEGVGQPLGYALLRVDLGNEFTSVRDEVGFIQPTLESLLVSRSAGNVTYWTPLIDRPAGAQPLTLALTGAQDAAAVFTQNETSGTTLDYRGKSVMFAARQVKAIGLMLMVKIDEAEALSHIITHTRYVKTSYLALAVMLTLAFAVIWKHSSAIRAKQDAIFYRSVANRLEKHERLLKFILNAMPQALFILDKEQQIRYVNDRMAAHYTMDGSAMIGKSMSQILGPVTGDRYAKDAHAAMHTGVMQTRVARLEDEAGKLKEIKLITHNPLKDIPLPDSKETSDGVLVIEKDITDITQEREQKEHTLKKLIETLVRMVDARDPYAANQSRLVSYLARELAVEMGLNPLLAEAAEIAGSLMNVGKILVPQELLTKSAPLESGELQQVRDSLQASADFLQDVPFEGPVVETLRQSQERVDGQGPLGMKAAEILPSAKVIAVCNSFVAMISPRSYRDALSAEEALANVLKQADANFERAVVSALMNYMDNRGGKIALAAIQQMKQ